MSAFKLEYKDYDFTIYLDLDPEHKPIERWNILSQEDVELLESGEMAFYSLSITSQNKEETVNHFVPGVQLPVDQEDQMVDLEIILIDEGLLDEILEHWKLKLTHKKTPNWA